MISESTQTNEQQEVAHRLAYRSNSAFHWLSSFWIWLTLCAVVGAIGLTAAARRSTLPDVDWNLYVATRVLDGSRLGVDYLEVNPPLVIWMDTIPVALGRVIGISAHQTMLMLLALVSVGSLIACDRALARLSDMPLVSRRAFVLAATFALFMLPGLDLTQREHVALMLTLPWVCLAAVRASKGSIPQISAVAAGVAAAIGFSLKPNFLCAWILIEAYLVYIGGCRVLRRTESLVLITLGVVYAALIVLLTPDYLPMAFSLRDLYFTYLNNGVFGTLILGLRTWLPWFLLVAAAHWHCDRRPDHIRAVLAAATIGYFVGAIVQEKGLGYHFVTPVGFGFLLAAIVALRSGGRLPWYPSSVIVQLGWMVIPVVALSVSVATLAEIAARDRAQYNANPQLDILTPIVRREADGEPIMVFSSNPASAWPLITQSHVKWASRYMSLWPLAGLYYSQLGMDHRGPVVFQPLANRSGLERQFHDAVIDDLERYRPKLLLVLEVDDSVRGFGGAANLDYLAYFGEDPRFVRWFSGYRDIGNVGRYRFYRRKD